jgi:hypothetical protein
MKLGPTAVRLLVLAGILMCVAIIIGLASLASYVGIKEHTKSYMQRVDEELTRVEEDVPMPFSDDYVAGMFERRRLFRRLRRGDSLRDPSKTPTAEELIEGRRQLRTRQDHERRLPLVRTLWALHYFLKDAIQPLYDRHLSPINDSSHDHDHDQRDGASQFKQLVQHELDPMQLPDMEVTPPALLRDVLHRTPLEGLDLQVLGDFFTHHDLYILGDIYELVWQGSDAQLHPVRRPLEELGLSRVVSAVIRNAAAQDSRQYLVMFINDNRAWYLSTVNDLILAVNDIPRFLATHYAAIEALILSRAVP